MMHPYYLDRRFAVRLLIATMLLLSVGCMQSPEEKYAGFMESGLAAVEEGDYAAALIHFKNASRIDTNQAEPLYQMARCHLNRGQTQEAVNAVQQAVRLNPDHVEANLLLARFMIRLGNAETLPQAEEMLNGVLGQDSTNSEALFVLAATRVRQGSVADAERLLQEAIKNQPEHLNAAMALARLRMSEGKLDEAEQVLQNAVDQSEDKRMARVALGQFYTGQDQLDKAREQYDTILAEDSQYAPAWLGIGMLHLRNNERDEAEKVYQTVSKLEDDNDQYKPLYAQILMMNGKTEESIAEYERLYEENPDSRTLRGSLVTAYVRTGQVDKAEQILTDTINKTPKDSDARLQRAEVNRRAGRLDKAQEDLTAVLEVRPNSHEAHYFLSKVHQARGDARLQRQELDEAIRIDPTYVAARLEMAQAMLQTENKNSALDVLNEAPEDQANSIPILAAKVWAYISLERMDDAGKVLASIPDEQRDNAEFNLQEGVLRSSAGDYPGAQTYLSRALEQAPQDLRALHAYAGTFVSQKKMGRAIEVVRKQAELYPDSPKLQLALAGWYERAQYPAEARAAYRAAHEAGDTTGEAAIMTARLDSAEGRKEEAIQTLEELLDRSPRNLAAWQMLGLIQDAAGNDDEAILAYRKAVDFYPENFVALNNLAYLLSKKDGALEEALTFAQRAKEFAPDSAEVDDTLGWIFYQRGVYATAAVHLRAAASANPKNALTQFHLAMAQAKTGDVAGARRTYETALKLEPEMPEAKDALAVIESAQ